MIIRTKIIPQKLDIQYLYTYDELSEETKQKMIDYYCNSLCQQEVHNELFYDDVNYELKEILKNSDFKVYYSLSYSQSDYFTINGNIYYIDILEMLKDELSEKEYKTLIFYINYLDFYININRNYLSRNYDFEDMTYELEANNIRDINYELCEKFRDMAYEKFNDMCYEYKKRGLDFIYNIPEEEAIEYYKSNFEYFDENGEWIE